MPRSARAGVSRSPSSPCLPVSLPGGDGSVYQRTDGQRRRRRPRAGRGREGRPHFPLLCLAGSPPFLVLASLIGPPAFFPFFLSFISGLLPFSPPSFPPSFSLSLCLLRPYKNLFFCLILPRRERPTAKKESTIVPFLWPPLFLSSSSSFSASKFLSYFGNLDL